MTTNQQIPKTHRALVLTSTDQPPEVKTIPTPQPGPGSAVVRIEAANILTYSKYIYNGARKYPFPTPLVIGSSALGRIVATGPDAVLLEAGKFVFVDCFVRARDDTASAFLLGIHEGHTEKSKKLMQGEWRDATYAEYAKLPLESCYPLNEELLVGKLGYKMEDLQEIPRNDEIDISEADLTRLMVPYGGLADINLKLGETVVIAPATGDFGRAAVKVALAMGARVIAMGRNSELLAKLAASDERIEWVQITGDVQEDTKSLQAFGTVDAYFDISPREASKSTHFKSCILALKHSGRACFMGGLLDDLAIPLRSVVQKDLKLCGKWMYSRQNVKDLIGLVEFGALKLGGQKVDKFSLDDWEKGFDTAAGYSGIDEAAIFVP
ncbi:L-threonine 3-dehydrogenase [Lachnellula suecica]|uniref:L-threonine 3-dehydrogenase n=1 Tax=Lachnellula suecica TaxID=602035 RepID=A0A8T9CDN9_9HELO|nr:L-threonine 3-dehydrogenase [Lachnellula suecica]